jgi:hypothetical protein
MNATSSLLVNNFGLTDSQILAYSGCADNVEPFLTLDPSSKGGIAHSIDSGNDVDLNMPPVADSTACSRTTMSPLRHVRTVGNDSSSTKVQHFHISSSITTLRLGIAW